MPLRPDPNRMENQPARRFNVGQAASAFRQYCSRLVSALEPTGPESHSLTVLVGIVLSLSLFHYLHDTAKFLAQAPFIDFAHYYAYASVVKLGQNPFDPQAVAQVEQGLNLRRAAAPPNYPPLFYLFMQPFLLLPFRAAAWVWFFISQACLVGTFLLCLRRFGASTPLQVTAALFVIFTYQPLMEDLALGQANVLLLFLLTLGWWSLHARNPWITGIAVATALHIKIQFALVVPILWWVGQQRAAWCAALLAGMGTIFGIIILGPLHYLQYLQCIVGLPPDLVAWAPNLSLRGTLHRLFSDVTSGVVWADGIWLAASFCVITFLANRVPRSTPPNSLALDWSWGLALSAVLLVSPHTLEHHLVVLLLPITLLLLCSQTHPGRLNHLGVLIGSILLLGARYSLDQFPEFHKGLPSLLMTGKLLGLVLLTWALVRRVKEKEAPAP